MQRRALNTVAHVDVCTFGHEKRGYCKTPRLSCEMQRGQTCAIWRVYVRPLADQALDGEDRAG
jgi:hypothetical protein